MDAKDQAKVEGAIKTLRGLLPPQKRKRKVQDAKLSAWMTGLVALVFSVLFALWFWIAGWLCK